MDFIHHENLDTKEIIEMEMYFFEEIPSFMNFVIFCVTSKKHSICKYYLLLFGIVIKGILFGCEVWTNSTICYTNADTKKLRISQSVSNDQLFELRIILMILRKLKIIQFNN